MAWWDGRSPKNTRAQKEEERQAKLRKKMYDRRSIERKAADAAKAAAAARIARLRGR